MNRSIPLASLAISVVGRCTIACKHCYELSGPKTKGEFSFEQLTHFITAARSFGIQHVFLAGGEPLLHPRIADVVEFAVKSGMHPNISTNGHLISEEILAKLLSAGISHDLSVSIDGPTEKVNDSIRGRGAFIRTIHGMHTLNAFQGIMWGVNFVSCGLNLGHALETALLAKRLGTSYFNLIKVTPFGRARLFEKSLLISEEQYRSEVEGVREHFRNFGSFFDHIKLFDLSGDLEGRASSYFNKPCFEELPCGISIDHTGRVALSPPSIMLGNCLETDITDLIASLNTERVQNVYEKWLRNEHVGIHQPPVH